MWFRCLGSCVAWLLVAAIGLLADAASAEENRYAISKPAPANAVGLSGIATAATLRYDLSQPADGFNQLKLSLEKPRLPHRKLFNRVSVGKTFDGFGLHWEAGQLELALTDEGVARILDIWRKELEIPGLPLAERHYT